MAGRCAPLAATLMALLVSTVAMAQGKDPSAADALFRAGREAMKNKDYATACPKFAESQRLDPAAGTLLNLAQCEEGLGKTASAVQHYKDAAELFPPADPRVAIAKDRIAALSPKVPKLTIKLETGAPEGTKVVRSGVELGPASLGMALPVDPGEQVVVVSAPGRAEKKTTIVIKAGESREVTVEAGEDAAGGTAGQPAKEKAPDSGSGRGSTVRTLGYVTGGLGLIGLGAGTYFVLKAKDQDDKALKTYDQASGTCMDQNCVDWTDKSRTSSKIATAGFIGGGVLLVTGIVMVIAAPSSSAPPSSSKVAVGIGGPGTWLGANVAGTW